MRALSGSSEAIAATSQALAIDPDYAQAHNNLGLLYQDKNLLDESARELQRALIIEPGYARAHNNFGVTLLRQGKLDAAASRP